MNPKNFNKYKIINFERNIIILLLFIYKFKKQTVFIRYTYREIESFKS